MDKSNDDFMKNLNVILNEAKNSRTELLQYSNESLNHIWKSSTFLILFIGLLATSTTFLYGNGESIANLPLIFSFILITFALFFSITGTLPSKSLLVPDPDVLYELMYEENDQLMEKLIQTYLINNKRYMLLLEKKSFVRGDIHILTIGSIIEYIIFVGYCIYNQYEFSFEIGSFLLFCIILFYGIYKKRGEIDDINRLKKELNLD